MLASSSVSSLPAPAGFPVTLVPARAGTSLLPWLQRELPRLNDSLRSRGAVLLRGFPLADPAQFAAVARTIAGPLDERYEGPSPRTALGSRGVYTASEVSPLVAIAEHAELSYLARMPRHLFFWCRTPSPHGGGTTLVDGRRVLARLDRGLIAPLLEGPLRIHRRHARPRGLHDPFELKRWPSSFGTTDRTEVLALAEASGFTARFERDGALRLEHTQPVLRTHPETGESAWLNHLLVFHASAPVAVLAQRRLRAQAMQQVARAYRRLWPWLGREVASDVTLVDGSPIDDAIVAHVRRVVAEESVAVRWQRGDLVIVDNHIAMHGREPYRGEREVIATWSAARA